MDRKAEAQKAQQLAHHHSVNKRWTGSIWPQSLPGMHHAALGFVGQQEGEAQVPSSQAQVEQSVDSRSCSSEACGPSPVWVQQSVTYYPEGLTCSFQPWSSPLSHGNDRGAHLSGLLRERKEAMLVKCRFFYMPSLQQPTLF